jgi:siroheme synthase
MSGASLREVISKLLLNGADASTPFIVVEQATTPSQYVYDDTLQQFIRNRQAVHFISPSLVIIGKVAGLYKEFAWLPLSNERMPYFMQLDLLTELFNELKNGDNVSRV